MLSDLFSPIRLTCVIAGSRARDAITYMTVTERFVIIEHASVVITSVYWIIKAEKEGREEPRPRAETEIFFRRLKSWETFLGSGIITYTHLPETVDRKYALSAERTTFFSLLVLPQPTTSPLPPPALRVATRAPWQSDERQSSPVRDINKSDKPTGAETTYFASYISLAWDAVTGLSHVFVFLWLLLATYSGAGDDNSYPSW